ncbi:hypothetical protein I5W35_19300 [Stenotrophomonas maltophilia]|nr:hypothetical protein [Stenotrophomonas maltophilia]
MAAAKKASKARKAPAKKAPVKREASAGEAKNRRAALRMTGADFDRIRYEILPSEKTSWQDMLETAVNSWLRERGYDPLENVE